MNWDVGEPKPCLIVRCQTVGKCYQTEKTMTQLWRKLSCVLIGTLVTIMFMLESIVILW